MCLFPNSAETTDPNELKFCGMISLRMGGYRLKNIQVWSTVCQKSSYPKESSSRYSHFASIVMQPLVYHNVTVYMCTLLFSPSTSLLFFIFINKTFPFILHMFPLFDSFLFFPCFCPFSLFPFFLFWSAHFSSPSYLGPYSFPFFSPSLIFPFFSSYPSCKIRPSARASILTRGSSSHEELRKQFG